MLIRTSAHSIRTFCRESNISIVIVALALVITHSCLSIECAANSSSSPSSSPSSSSSSSSLSSSSSSSLSSPSSSLSPSTTTVASLLSDNNLTTKPLLLSVNTTLLSPSQSPSSSSSSLSSSSSSSSLSERNSDFETTTGSQSSQETESLHSTSNNSNNDLYFDDPNERNDKLPEHVISDIMPDYIRENGGIIFHILLLIYVSLSLGIICDVYFLTSIELIGEKLRLPSDIAGATFMALGTSAPELFVGLIGVFITQDDIGTSTILGSAMFNLIFVPGVCGFAIYFSGMKMPKISKYSILRDAIYYMIAITVVLLVMKDNRIDWVESLCMLLVFGVYLTILYFIAQLGELEILDEEDETSETESNETSPLLKNHSFIKSTSIKLDGSQTILDVEKSGVEKSRERRSSSVRPRFLSMNDECESNVEGWVESNRFIKILMFPALLCFRLTVPRPQKQSCSYLFSFAISIIWISFFTYAAVWLVDIIGYTFRLPQTVVGLTILAAGASIPEVISSVLVVKRGLANMALCNLFGSNIFDILVCLGLPWLIKSIMNMVQYGTVALDQTYVTVHSNGLLLTILTLLISVVLYLITFSRTNWRLGLQTGICLTIIYAAIITLSTLYEIYLN